MEGQAQSAAGNAPAMANLFLVERDGDGGLEPDPDAVVGQVSVIFERFRVIVE